MATTDTPDTLTPAQARKLRGKAAALDRFGDQLAAVCAAAGVPWSGAAAGRTRQANGTHRTRRPASAGAR